MFARLRKNATSIYDEPIKKAMLEMTTFDMDSSEYREAFAVFKELVDLKEKSRRKVSPDTLAIIAANLAGILLIVSYEHAHVVSSKAMSHILKPR